MFSKVVCCGGVINRLCMCERVNGWFYPRAVDICLPLSRHTFGCLSLSNCVLLLYSFIFILPTGLLKTPDVFFTAKDLVKRDWSTGQIFVFPTLVENRGEGYNKASGVFTAPVDGDYIFTTQMCNTAGQYVYLAFVVDDKIQTPMAIYDKSSHTCATATLISRLKAGARVAIKSTSTSKVLFSSSHYGSHFSGYLLRKYVP